MLKTKVLLDYMDKVREFVAAARKEDYPVELTSGDKTVDAKSITNVFALDLTRPLTVTAYSDTTAELFREIRKFIVK